MKTATFASAATLLSTSYAASVTLQTTRCLDKSIPYGEKFAIEINTAKPVVKELPTVCGLRIISATNNIDVHTIQCQAFGDAAGTQVGSAVFTYESPALIATNPVQEGAIKCVIVPTTYFANKRQVNNGTVVASSQSAASGSSVPVLTLTSLATPSAQSSGAQSTITSTTVVGPSSGMPSSSGNATISSISRTPSATPSATQSGRPQETGAAGKVGVGMGVVLGAVVAMFV